MQRCTSTVFTGIFVRQYWDLRERMPQSVSSGSRQVLAGAGGWVLRHLFSVLQDDGTKGVHGEEGKTIRQTDAVSVSGISCAGGGICSFFSASLLRVK